AELALHAPALVVQVERHERVAGPFDLADQLVDLVALQQQLAGAHGIGLHVGGRFGQRRDVRADQEKLGVADHDVAFLQLGAAGANGLDLPAFEDEAGFETLLDEVIVEGLFVLGDAHLYNSRRFRAFRRVRADSAQPMTRPPHTVRKSVLVPYPAQRMFTLVDRVEDYPKFLPWCGGTEVDRHDENSMTATVRIDFKGLKQSFTTRNTAEAGRSIVMALRDGPFSHRHVEWRYTPLPGAA